MPSTSCQTCSSDIPSLVYPSSSKRQPQPYITPCCSTPICNSCLIRNPRLREYVPCLRCGDVKSAEGINRIRVGAIDAQRYVILLLFDAKANPRLSGGRRKFSDRSSLSGMTMMLMMTMMKKTIVLAVRVEAISLQTALPDIRWSQLQKSNLKLLQIGT